jgi:hypothetical protein
MKPIKPLIACGVLCLGLSACGGATTGPTAIPLTELVEQLNAFNQNPPTATTTDNLPISGSANFTGIGFSRDIDPASNAITFAAIGSAAVAVDFTRGTVSGSVSNFYAADDPSDIDSLGDVTGNLVAGNLDVELTQPLAGANAFAGSITGSLPQLGAQTKSIDYSAFGAFSGVTANGILIIGSDSVSTVAIVANKE